MAEQRTVMVALGMLRSHYPGEHPALEEATVYAWHATGLGGLPDEALLVAAEEWDTTAHRRFPSSGEFQAAAQATARRLAQERMEAARGPELPAAPTQRVGMVDLPVGNALDEAFVEAIRAGLTARQIGADYLGVVNATLAERGIAPLPEEVPDVLGTERPLAWCGSGEPGHETVRCHVCTDSGWLIRRMLTYGADTVRPCDQCRPIAYRRWHDGHFEPGHDCEECRLFRRHKPPVWAQELQAAGFDRRPGSAA